MENLSDTPLIHPQTELVVKVMRDYRFSSESIKAVMGCPMMVFGLGIVKSSAIPLDTPPLPVQ